LRATTNSRNFTVYTWEKSYNRNEALDCRVYARAAAHVMNMDLFKDSDWDKIKKYRKPIQKQGEPNPGTVKKPIKKSSFWDRH
jgi:phage terminase large subunit GpA-like protein